jgi:uncharacterized protein
VTAHFPGRPPIDAYGGGGFRFAGMSHRGSLLILPSGVYDWYPEAAALKSADFAALFAEQGAIRLVLLGTGETLRRPSRDVRAAFEARHLALEVMATSAAVRTWNILLAEGRQVAAALVAVEKAH